MCVVHCRVSFVGWGVRGAQFLLSDPRFSYLLVCLVHWPSAFWGVGMLCCVYRYTQTHARTVYRAYMHVLGLPPSSRRPSTCRPTPPVRSSWPPCIAQASGGWEVQGKSLLGSLQRRFQMSASGSRGCAAQATRPLSRSSSPTWDTMAGQSSAACSVVCC